MADSQPSPIQRPPTGARRVDPRSIFTPEEWAELTHPSRIMGMALVVHCWGLIALAVWLHVAFPNPLTWLVAVMVVGGRQLGLAILMHEAAHANLSRDPRLNALLGQWFCAAPVGADLWAYRPYHLRHHRFTQGPDDPDLGLSAAFPTSRASLARKIIRDLTGQTFFKQRMGLIAALWRSRGEPRAERPQAVTAARTGAARFLAVNTGLAMVFVATGAGWAFITVWLVAMATWFPLVTRLRNIGEHAVVGPADDPFRHARTVHANPIERLLVAPYWVHHHTLHHLWMYLPCWRLDRAWRLIEAKRLDERFETASGYLDVLRRATTHPGGRVNAGGPARA